MNIVVVEDCPEVLGQTLELLSTLPGVRVIGSAKGAAQAVELVQRCNPDLLLLDLSLSFGSSGREVLRQVRSGARCPRVVILSQHPADSHRQPCLEAGADAFIEKASALQELPALISAWMPPLPINEADRLHALQQLQILDSPPEADFDAIVRLACTLSNSPMATISLVDSERQWFKSRLGLAATETSRSVAFCAWTICGSEPLEIEDALLDPRFANNPLVRGEPGIRYYLGLPLVLSDGETLGTLCVFDRVPRRLDGACLESLRVLARSVVAELELRRRVLRLEREIVWRQQTERNLVQLATRDSLTRLPNRAALIDRLQQATALARRRGDPLALLFLDLDRFKWVNDSLGHAAGDALLREAATRLRACLREADTVARLGGDEFALLLPGVAHEGEVEAIAQQVIAAVSLPVMLEGHQVQIGCSIGAAIFPQHGEHEEVLLRHADLAMYAAKQSGSDRFCLYAESMSQRAIERMTLESELRAGIEGGQLRLWYQPQICLANYRLSGLEALVRWQHPKLGLLPPDRFVPVAEDCGAIWALGLKVLDLAVGQLASWDAQGLVLPRMAVNVSAAQLREELPAALSEILARHGIAANRLELELTETALAADGPAVIGLLQRLQAMGATVAIDDFGVGYSSLALLRRLSISTLKIDRSFVTEVDSNGQDAAIVEAIVAMARSLGLRTVAEGVETPTHNVALRVMGCDHAQGYLYSRPMAPDAVEVLLERGVLRPNPANAYSVRGTQI
jgi:diguanylate cyclase (GGDEF)-like protein